MEAWVRGGSTTSAYDQMLVAEKARAEASRREEDARTALAEANPIEARQHTMKLGGNRSGYPGIVLVVKHLKDNVVLDYISCELIVDQDGNLQLNMACYSCAQRGITDNFKISQKNRHFELDTRRQGEIWVNPNNPREFVHLAGTIHLTEWVRCPNLGCHVSFKIEDSVLRTK